jgi:hypothetical protein
MKTMIIWLLISVSTGTHNKGDVSIIERFTDLNQCKAMRQSILSISSEVENNVAMRCIQAEVIK